MTEHKAIIVASIPTLRDHPVAIEISGKEASVLLSAAEAYRSETVSKYSSEDIDREYYKLEIESLKRELKQSPFA